MTRTSDPLFLRTDETFSSGGTTCAAWVYRPRSADELDVPVVVMAHGLAGIRGVGLVAYAERFAAAGYGVVVFDYRSFGDSGGEPRQMVSARSQLEDWRAALRFARGLAGMDSTKVIAWGTSFGGGHVVTLASEGEPLAAIIAQVPFMNGVAAMRSMGLRKVARLAVPGILDTLRGLLHMAPLYIPSVGASGETAVMTSPDAEEGHRRIVRSAGQKVADVRVDIAARFVLEIAGYAPGRRADRVGCPALVQVAEKDVVTPTGVALGAAHSIPDSTVRTYPGGHFDLYVDPLFPTVVADQIEFLRNRVPSRSRRRPGSPSRGRCAATARGVAGRWRRRSVTTRRRGRRPAQVSSGCSPRKSFTSFASSSARSNSSAWLEPGPRNCSRREPAMR